MMSALNNILEKISNSLLMRRQFGSRIADSVRKLFFPMKVFFFLYLFFANVSANGLALNDMITKEGILNQPGSIVKFALKTNGKT